METSTSYSNRQCDCLSAHLPESIHALKFDFGRILREVGSTRLCIGNLRSGLRVRYFDVFDTGYGHSCVSILQVLPNRWVGFDFTYSSRALLRKETVDVPGRQQ